MRVVEKKNSLNGFILLETLLALSLLGVVLALGIRSLAVVLRGVERADRLCGAAAITQQEISRIRHHGTPEEPEGLIPGFEVRTGKVPLHERLDQYTITVSWDGPEGKNSVQTITCISPGADQ